MKDSFGPDHETDATLAHKNLSYSDTQKSTSRFVARTSCKSRLGRARKPQSSGLLLRKAVMVNPLCRITRATVAAAGLLSMNRAIRWWSMAIAESL